METLTIQKLLELPPNAIFAKGEAFIRHPWYAKWQYERQMGAYKTVTKEGTTKVKWVAVRGFYHDWAIYHSLDANFEYADYLDGDSHLMISYERVSQHGAKLHHDDEIKKLVPCDEKAFRMYRH